jgi:hypothetical protein
MVKKSGNELALGNSASLAAIAWNKLETAAHAAMNGEAPALQLYSNGDGITAKVSDKHGTTVLVQGGKISVQVASATEPE